MPVKLTPEWKFTAYPRTAITCRRVDPVTIADLMADIVAGESSSWGGILTRGAQNGEWADWGRLESGLILNNVGFARFLPDGTVSTEAKKGEKGTGGFFVNCVVAPLRSIGDQLGPLGAPGGDNTLPWTATNGTFQATPAITANGEQAIENTGDTALVAVAVTDTTWPPGKGIVLDMALSAGRSGGGTAQFRIHVSDNLRVSFREGHPIALERRALVESGGASTEKWVIWESLTKAGDVDARGTIYHMRLHVLGGRLVWEVNGHKGWLVDSDTSPAPTSAPKGIVPRRQFEKVANMQALLGGEKLQIAVVGMRCRLELARMDYDNNGVPLIGTVARSVQVNTRSVRRGTALTPHAVGHMPANGTMEGMVDYGGATINYSVTLTPPVDGSTTPMLNQLLLRHEPAWVPGTGSGTDISAAVQHATVNHAHPPLQAGAEGSITIDRKVFASRYPDLESVIQDNCPVEISTRWTYDDGTRSDWKGIFKGYFHGISGEQRAFNAASLTLTIRDPIVRLRKPAADVDGRCPPLDYFLAERTKNAGYVSESGAPVAYSPLYGPGGAINVEPVPEPSTAYYGADGVKDIIEMFLGPAEAARMNGNGNARRYLASDQPAYMSNGDMSGSWLPIATVYKQTLSAGSMQMQGGARMPPPFGQDALTWINNIAQDEYCMFAYLWNDRDTDEWPQPTYGVRDLILQKARLHELSGTDAEKLLVQAASFETKPENDINRVRVTCKPFGQDAPFVPALIQGEARFGGSHPRSPERTWERTLVVDSALAVTAERARAIAYVTLAEAEGNSLNFPRHTFIGSAFCICGDVFVAHNVGLLGNESVWFRSLQVGHEYNTTGEEGRTWSTTVALGPMSLTERVAFARYNPPLAAPVYP